MMFKVPLSDIDLGNSEIRAVSSGTSALHLANLVLGIGPGDEVIVPSFTFVATVNAIIYCGAKPVFADINGTDDLNVSPSDIEKKITPKTKAICVVHYAGYPADMDKIMAIARQNHLSVLEDAAHAIGAEWKGKKMGTIGTAGCFSFFSNKNLATGEGGMMVTNDPHLAKRARLLRSHGMTSLSWDRFKGHASGYDVTEIGFNYRTTEIASAIGRIQLKKLNKNNDKRAKISRQYRKNFKGLNEILVPFSRFNGKPSCHIFPVLFKNKNIRNRMKVTLQKAGIQTSIHYPPVHRFKFYWNRYPVGDGLPITDDVASRELTLPLFPGMYENQIRLVSEVLIDNLR